jgi:hypothetical protein
VERTRLLGLVSPCGRGCPSWPRSESRRQLWQLLLKRVTSMTNRLLSRWLDLVVLSLRPLRYVHALTIRSRAHARTRAHTHARITKLVRFQQRCARRRERGRRWRRRISCSWVRGSHRPPFVDSVNNAYEQCVLPCAMPCVRPCGSTMCPTICYAMCSTMWLYHVSDHVALPCVRPYAMPCVRPYAMPCVRPCGFTTIVNTLIELTIPDDSVPFTTGD